MIKKVLLTVFVIVIVLQTACINNGTQSIKLTKEQQSLVENFNEMSLEEKQVFNYMINETYRYYKYISFKDDLPEFCWKKVKKYHSKFVDVPFNNFDVTVYVKDSIRYMNVEKHCINSPHYKVDFVSYTEENLEKREKAYIKMLDKMYEEVEGFSKLSNSEKNAYSFFYNEVFKVKLDYCYGESTSLSKIMNIRQELCDKYNIDSSGVSIENTSHKTHIYTLHEINRKISKESFERIYNNLLEDHKKFYSFLEENIRYKGSDVNRTYTFEEPVDYDFIEYLVCLYFDRADDFELYKFTFDDCGLVKSFTYKSIEEIVKEHIDIE